MITTQANPNISLEPTQIESNSGKIIKEETSFFNLSTPLQEIVVSYKKFIQHASQEQRISDLITKITHNVGNEEPTSEGLAYLLNKSIQYITREYKQTTALTTLQEKVLIDKEDVLHLLSKSSDLPPEKKVLILQALDNQIALLEDLKSFSAGQTTSKVLLLMSCLASSFSFNAIVKTPVLLLSAWTGILGLASAYKLNSANTENLKIKHSSPFKDKISEGKLLTHNLNTKL